MDEDHQLRISLVIPLSWSLCFLFRVWIIGVAANVELESCQELLLILSRKSGKIELIEGMGGWGVYAYFWMRLNFESYVHFPFDFNIYIKIKHSNIFQMIISKYTKIDIISSTHRSQNPKILLIILLFSPLSHPISLSSSSTSMTNQYLSLQY